MRNKQLLAITICILTAALSHAQTAIPANTIITQSFNGIGSSATAALPANWKMSSAGTGATANWATGTNITATTQAANSGTPTTGGAYNWGTASGTDRAIGFMPSGSYASPNSIMAYYRNTTGATITSITVSFAIECYRINTAAFNLTFFSSADGSTWTARTGGDITATGFTPVASSYTFAQPTTIVRTITINGLSILNNGDFYLRWLYNDAAAATAQGLGLDNVSVFAGTATPVIVAQLRDVLSIDNPILNQANSGDQLTYTTVIKNTGTGDATNVILTEPAPTNTTLAGGSVKTSALARDDNYTTALNTALTGNNVLTNDFGLPSPAVVSFGPSANAATTAAGGTGISDNGGTIAVNSNGTFTYTPATGFTGTDKFAYIATNGNAPDNNAIVTITVGTAAGSVADAYNVTGNVGISTTIGQGVLQNDAGDNKIITAVNGSAANVGAAITTAQGGTLTVNSNGSFSYNPLAGYEGSDNFTYTIDNGFAVPSTATVTFTISSMIWFVNNSLGTNGDGRLSAPFNNLASLQAINNGTGNNPAAGDNIFLYTGSSNYTGGITLLSNQKLFGAAASVSLATMAGITVQPYTVTLPSTGQPSPSIVNAGGNGVLLNSAGTANTIRGFTIQNSTGSAVSGSGFGTLTVSEVSINTNAQAVSLTNGALSGSFASVSSSGGANNLSFSNCTGSLAINAGTCSGASGTSFVVTGGSVTITTDENISQVNNTALVSISGGHATGTITFQNGMLSATNGTGLQFDNADGNYNFNGTTALNGGDAGIDIINGSSGNFTFMNAPITNPSGTAFNVNGGSGSIGHAGTISKNSAGRLVDIQSRGGGSVSLTGNLSAATSCTGINVSSCTAGTVTFSGTTKTMNTPAITPVTLATNTGAAINFTGGGLAITSTTATGFNATGGGTVTVQGTGNTIVATTGTALNVANTTIGAGNMTFQSINKNGGTNGIVLNTTGTSGGLVVTGSGTTAGSGGTIQNCTGSGIMLTSTGNVNLSNMNISGNQDDGITGSAVAGFLLANCNILNNGNSTTDEGIEHLNLSGNVGISNTTITGSAHNNLYIRNTAGTLSVLTIINSSFSSNSATTGNHGILVDLLGTAQLASSSITGSTFASNKSIGIQVTGADNAVITLMTISGCTFTGNQIAIDFSGFKCKRTYHESEFQQQHADGAEQSRH